MLSGMLHSLSAGLQIRPTEEHPLNLLFFMTVWPD